MSEPQLRQTIWAGASGLLGMDGVGGGLLCCSFLFTRDHHSGSMETTQTPELAPELPKAPVLHLRTPAAIPWEAPGTGTVGTTR